MYKGSIKPINPPKKITGEFSFRATVHNGSDRHWESAGPNPINICYHWLDEDWSMVVFDGKRSKLPEGGIPPGDSAEVEIAILPPPNPGLHRLHLTLVEEGICWFDLDKKHFSSLVSEIEIHKKVDIRSAKPNQDLRIAFVGSPRSGNVWLHRILIHSLSLSAYAVHTPDEFAWDNIPSRCILQLHWRPESAFRNKLASLGFTPLVLRRHPLDLLISILHFCRHEPQTARWLAGLGGDENKIINAAPTDHAFVEYACSERARALLSLSSEWVDKPETIDLPYEQLVADPFQTVSSLIERLGQQTDPSQIKAALDSNALPVMRQTGNCHGWMGQPGIWRRLILANDAAMIVQAHKNLFQLQGYSMEPDRSLTSSDSLSLWEKISLGGIPRETDRK
jgi:hypothetical protein